MFEDFGNTQRDRTRLTREEQEALEDQKVLKIKYSLFEKIILDFQLKSHHNFLKKFINLFREYDSSNLGYINEEQFDDMIDKIDPDKSQDKSKLLKPGWELDFFLFKYKFFTCFFVIFFSNINKIQKKIKIGFFFEKKIQN